MDSKLKQSCVVNTAFEPVGSTSLTDKLARLNELLLYKTISVEERRDFGYWIPLPRDWWKSEFADDYTEVQNAAIKSGLMEVNCNDRGTKRYCSNAAKAPKAGQAFCASYRLSEAFRTSQTQLWELDRKPRSKAKELQRLSHSGQLLAGMLPGLRVDPTAASCPWDSIAATFFNRGFHRPNECHFGRFHSALTGISKQLRQTLRVGGFEQNNRTHMEYKGSGETAETGGPFFLSSSSSRFIARSMVSLDVSNCQPLCLAIECAKQSAAPDVAHWKQLAEEGATYDSIEAWLRQKRVAPFRVRYGRKSFMVVPASWNREQVKKQFMVAMFGDDSGAPVWKAIEAQWPTVAAIARGFKKNRYQALAHLCQRIESQIIIQDACSDLVTRCPGIVFGTIHDCIVAPANHEADVRRCISEAFGRQGASPTIKSEMLAA